MPSKSSTKSSVLTNGSACKLKFFNAAVEKSVFLKCFYSTFLDAENSLFTTNWKHIIVDFQVSEKHVSG